MSCRDLAAAFNECINRRDLQGLAELMADGHVFVDSANNSVVGKAACLSAWQGFFAAFPYYHNEFDFISAEKRRVVIAGRSRCSDPRLAGPTLWTAIVEQSLISEWRVLEDTPENRILLGLDVAGP